LAKAADGRRVQMVERQVLQSIAGYVARFLSREYPALITISRVKMPADLRSAWVHASIINLEGKSEKKLCDYILEDLQKRSWEIQNHVNAELKLRYCPKITFELDTSTEKALHVDNLIRSLAGDANKK
jgi:ribosome-binding factor A